MNRQAAWHSPGRFNDPRYGTLFTTGQPLFHPQNLFLEFCCQDAWLDASAAPSRLRREYAKNVAAGDWWVRNPSGQRVAGWSSERRAVNLARPEPWGWLNSHAYELAGLDGFQRIHWDDVSLHPILAGVSDLVDQPAWNRLARDFMRNRITTIDSINGGKDWLVTRIARPQTIKLEHARRDYPWGTRQGNPRIPMTWNSWVFGVTDWGPGIKRMTESGKTVVWDYAMAPNWTTAQQSDMAEIIMGSILLFDNAAAMFHAHGTVPGWWRTPLWFPACEWPERLGAPTMKCGQWPDGSWRRHFKNGTVIVEKGGASARLEYA